jgi:putative transposase
MTRANPLRSRVSGNDHARFWRRASTGDCARLASGYALCGRTLTLILGKDAAGKQLTLVLELAEMLPPWVNQQNIRQCRIVKEGQIDSAIFTVERQLPNGKPLSPSKIVALDPNHKNFAYAVGSDGKATEIQNPYFLKSFDKRIDRLKSKRDHCQKQARLITREDGSQFWLPSRRWLMLNSRLQDVLRKRREQTKQFLYTVANRLYHDYDAQKTLTRCTQANILEI